MACQPKRRALEARRLAGDPTSAKVPYAPKLLRRRRASAGSVLRMPLVKIKDIVELNKQVSQLNLIATVLQNGKNYKQSDLSGFCGILLGKEGQGLSIKI